MWLLIIVLCSGLLLAVFGVLASRRPVVGGLGIAAMVLLTVAAALAARPGGFAGLWPRVARPYVRPEPVPPRPDVRRLKRRLAELGERQERVVRKSLDAAWDNWREAYESFAVEKTGIQFDEPRRHWDESGLALGPILPGRVKIPEHPEDMALAVPPGDQVGPWPPVASVPAEKWLDEVIRDSLGRELQLTSVGREQKAFRPIASSILLAVAIGVLLYVGYLFLDTGTRGHFTWSLRLMSILVFVVVYVALMALR